MLIQKNIFVFICICILGSTHFGFLGSVFFLFCPFLYFPELTPKEVQNQGSLIPLSSGSWIPASQLKIRTDSVVPEALYTNLIIRTD